MEHIDFVMWVVGWGFYLGFTSHGDSALAGIVSIIKLILWVGIAWALW